jgi:TRAP-type C4-dicarboxylate transport system substrate-binding protein
MRPATMRPAVPGSDPSVSSSRKGASVNGIRWVAAIALLALAAGAGCSGGDKAGGSGGIVTLRLATDDDPEAAAGRQIEEFARQVRRLSEGRLRIHIGWRANGRGPHRRAFDQLTARKVIDGKYELALVPSRAWDVFGVRSLQAIQAPLLVNSDALLDKVASDPVAEKMLSGLDDVGVVGLALWPEALRHPVGFGHPLRSVADFAGKGIRAPRSELTWEILRALGARPLDLVGDEMGPAIDSGQLSGAESEIGLVRTNLPRPGIVTANVTFFPKANTIVANRGAFERLTDDQRETLRKAAAETLHHVVASRPTDVMAARSECGVRVQIVVASDVDIRGLVRATRPVVARLERDDLTRRSIQRIVALRETVSGSRPVIAPCGHPGPATTKAKVGGRQATLPPDGVYRSLIKPAEFLRAGLDGTTARNNSGLFTLTLRGGRLSWTIKGSPTVYTGRYFLSKRTVRYVLDKSSPGGSGPGGWLFSARWRSEDGGIRLTDVVGPDGPPFDQVAWARLWRRIDAP